MPVLLRNLPVYQTRRPATLPNGTVVPVLPYQIVLWASIGRKGQETLDPRTPRFPVVLDPGYNHNFLIQETHLVQWAGWRPEHFAVLAQLQAYGQAVPLRAANVWLHRNRPGQRDAFVERASFCLELDLGIAVCPRGLENPRLPLLGLRALFRAGLMLSLDCQRGYLSLRTPRRFWWFG
jgi:hypothetical protein